MWLKAQTQNRVRITVSCMACQANYTITSLQIHPEDSFPESTSGLDNLVSLQPGLSEEDSQPTTERVEEERGSLSASTLLDFFNQLQGGSLAQVVPGEEVIKEEPGTEEDLRAAERDRVKKDTHNISKSIIND